MKKKKHFMKWHTAKYNHLRWYT